MIAVQQPNSIQPPILANTEVFYGQDPGSNFFRGLLVRNSTVVLKFVTDSDNKEHEIKKIFDTAAKLNDRFQADFLMDEPADLRERVGYWKQQLTNCISFNELLKLEISQSTYTDKRPSVILKEEDGNIFECTEKEIVKLLEMILADTHGSVLDTCQQINVIMQRLLSNVEKKTQDYLDSLKSAFLKADDYNRENAYSNNNPLSYTIETQSQGKRLVQFPALLSLIDRANNPNPGANANPQTAPVPAINLAEEQQNLVQQLSRQYKPLQLTLAFLATVIHSRVRIARALSRIDSPNRIQQQASLQALSMNNATLLIKNSVSEQGLAPVSHHEIVELLL